MQIKTAPAAATPGAEPRWRRIAATAIIVLSFIAIAAGIQISAGSYRAELASYPDEPAHAITGLALEQYLGHGLLQPPGRFLLDYYLHYPKVAIGHWPPLLYMAEGAAMLVFSPSKYSLLGLEALLAGILAWLVFRELKALVGTFPAALGAAALLANPAIAQYTSMAMAEILLTLSMFMACLTFARFAEQRRTRDAIWFGLWVSAAIMTKGTGWALLMVPALVWLATKDWKLPFERALWAAAATVAALCLPWQILTLKVASEGWKNQPGLGYTLWAAPQFAKILFTLPGIAIGAAAFLGVAYTLTGGWKGSRTRAYWATLAALAGAAWLFHILVPAGVEQRKLIIAIPALFVLAGAGAELMAHWIFPARQRQVAGIIFAFLALFTLVLSFPVEAKPRFGFVPVAAALDLMLPPQSAALLVSDSTGEGSIISEFALRRPAAPVYLVRGTKFLAAEDWNAQQYRQRVRSAEECARLLASVPIDIVVIDRRRSVRRQKFFNVIEDMLQSHTGEWTLAAEFQTPADSPHAIAIYRRSTGIELLRALPPWIVSPVRWANETIQK